MKLTIHTYKLRLKHPFTISRGTRTEIPSLVVELSENGVSGYGEATANPYYNTSTKQFKDDLESQREVIELKAELRPEDYWSHLLPFFGENRFVLCALDEAYNDLFAKLRKQPLYAYWGYEINPDLLTNYTIGIDDTEVMIKKMKEEPFPIYKIKLGTDRDLEIVEALRRESDAIFRIDANCGWTADETIKNAVALKKMGVEFIEQPLPAEDWEGARKVYENSCLPIIADESCLIEPDVARCKGHFHGINVKLMKCGGVTPARKMLEEARSYGMKTMVGCMTESTVGISAIAHLTPLLDFVDMDGALLISNDTASGVRVINGSIVFADEFGTGAKLIKHEKI